MAVRRNPCRCGLPTCQPCEAFRRYPERFLPDDEPEPTVEASLAQVQRATEALSKLKTANVGEARPVKTQSDKSLPVRLVECTSLGKCARPGHCGDQRKVCTLGMGTGGIVKHLEDCQTCSSYVPKPREPKKGAQKKSQKPDSGPTNTDSIGTTNSPPP